MAQKKNYHCFDHMYTCILNLYILVFMNGNFVYTQLESIFFLLIWENIL